MSRVTSNKRPSTTRSSTTATHNNNNSSTSTSTTTIQTTPTTSHEFYPSPLDSILAEQGLQRYRLEPPNWRAPWIPLPTSRDAGGAGSSANWPVFYPTRDGMDEDQLNESNVKQGYTVKLPIQADTFSAHGHVIENLKQKDMLSNLSRLVTAVQKRRESNLPTYGPSTFRLPSRITLTDSKREAWFSDLANPSVPLSKLSRSVPHGYKGEKGLDMLAMRKVEVGRAVWFVRAFGGVEIQSLAKSRPLPTAIAQYTSEFTSVVCEFVRKQLLDLALPDLVVATSTSPAALSSSVSNTQPLNHSRTRTTSSGLGQSSSSGSTMKGQSDFSDPEVRKSWKEKFDYTLNLLTSLLSASLLSTTQFVRFLVSLLDPASSTLPQLSVALLLVEEYWNDVLEDEATTARLIRSCLVRLEEVEQLPSTQSSSLHMSLATTLTSFIRSAFLALPDSCISLYPIPVYPSTALATSPVSLLPSQLSDKLETVLLEPGSNLVSTDSIEADPSILDTIRTDLADLAHRKQESNRISQNVQSTTSQGGGGESNDHSSFEHREKAQLELIHHLDNFSFPQSIASLHSTIFHPSSSSSSISTHTPTLSCSIPSTTSPNVSSSNTSPTLPPPLPSGSNQDEALTTSRPSRTNRSRLLPILPLEEALPLLFTWSTSPSRSPGIHRRYAVAKLIEIELERRRQGEEKVREKRGGGGGRTTRSKVAERTKGKKVVEEAFVKWVDERDDGTTSSSSSATEKMNNNNKGEKKLGSKEDVRALAEELMRSEVLSYEGYLQRMIARGETERTSQDGKEESLHLWIVRTAAIEDGDSNRRKVAIGKGASGDDRDSEELLETVRAMLADLIPGWSASIQDDHLPTFDASPALAATSKLASRGLHLTVTRDIVPGGLTNLQGDQGRITLEPEGLALLVAIFDEARDMVGLSQLLVVLLEHRPSFPLLRGILDVATARLDLFASLDASQVIAEAAFSNLEGSAGPVRRRLLTFLRLFATAGHLKGLSAETVMLAIQSLAVPISTPAPSQSVTSPPLVELQSLVVDSSPAAFSQVVTNLCSRYSPTTSDHAVTHLVEAAIVLLPSLASVDPIVRLFKELDERLPRGIETPLIRSISSKTTQHLTAMFGGPQGRGIVSFLTELVVDGTLSLPNVISLAFLPVWKNLLASTVPDLVKHANDPTAAPLQLDPTLSSALSTLSDALTRAVTDSYESPSSSPTGPRISPLSPNLLLRRQRKSIRLGSLFTIASIPTVTSLLSLLVLQQELFTAASLADQAQMSSSLFLQIVGLEHFQTLVVKAPTSIRNGMLEGEFIKSLPSFDSSKPKLLAALLLALKDGGDATPANLISTEDWDLFLSGLTMWRLAVSKVEVEASLERLELDSTLSNEERDEALHTLSNHFLERVCTGEGQTYLGEQVVKCYHGSASDELVSVAFTRLASAVATVSTSSPTSSDRMSAETTLRCTTRLLETLLQSGVATSRESALRQLLQAIASGLDRVISKGETSTGFDSVLLFSNILGLAVRCTDGPAEKSTTDLYVECLVSCGQLATMYSRTEPDGSSISTLLLDTCSHLLLALPDFSPSIRTPSIHSFLDPPPTSSYAASLRQLSLVQRLPDLTFARMSRLFGSYAPSSLVPNPWELLDHSDPLSSSSTAPASLSSSLSRRTVPASPAPAVPGIRQPLTNLGPIDLAAFRARVIETVPAVTALDALSSTSSSSTSSARPSSLVGSGESFTWGKQTNFDFETKCTGLSVQAKDHRRTISLARNLAFKFEQAASASNVGAVPPPANPVPPSTQSHAQQPSTASSGTIGTRKRNVTGEGDTTMNGTGTVESSGVGTRGTKRKGTSSTSSGGGGGIPEVITLDDDDEDEVVATKPPPAKKGRTASSSTAGKAKKKSTK